MRTLPLAEVKNQFSAVVDEVTTTHEAVTVTRNGEPVVVVLAGDDYESLMETLALAFDEEGRSRLTEADESIAAGDVTTGEEMAELMRQRAARDARGRS
jgi:prevent-host-death family protein